MIQCNNYRQGHIWTVQANKNTIVILREIRINEKVAENTPSDWIYLTSSNRQNGTIDVKVEVKENKTERIFEFKTAATYQGFFISM